MTQQSGRDDLVRRPDPEPPADFDDLDRLQLVDADESSLDEFSSEDKPSAPSAVRQWGDVVTRRVSEPVTVHGHAVELPLRFGFDLGPPFESLPSMRRARRRHGAPLVFLVSMTALVGAFFVLPQDTRAALTGRARLELARLTDRARDVIATRFNTAAPSSASVAPASASDRTADALDTPLSRSAPPAIPEGGPGPSFSVPPALTQGAAAGTLENPLARLDPPAVRDLGATPSTSAPPASTRGATADSSDTSPARSDRFASPAAPATSTPPASTRGATADSPATPSTRSDRTARASGAAPPSVAARPHAPGDFSGAWLLTNYVDQSGVEQFRTLTLGFRVQLEQSAGRVSGRGVKVMENGQMLSGRSRTPIAVAGAFDGQSLRLTMVEGGTGRTSRGTIALHVAGDGSLEGEFASDAGTSRGRSRAVRVREGGQ